MKHSYLILLSLLVALLFLGTTAALATESVVFVDDDPVNSDGQTFYVGTWTQSTFFPQTYGQGYHFSTSTGSLTMRALLDIDETGGGVSGTSGSQFQAFARWSAGNNRCNAVRIEVRNATTNTTITSEVVNQTTQGLQFNWTPIGGRFTATPNQLYEIRFISPGVCVTTADGGMFVQQTYDSSDVFNLTRSSIVDEAGTDFAESTSSFALSTSTITPTTILTDSITCPPGGTGYVIATGSAWAALYANSTSTTTIPFVRFSVSTATGYDFAREAIHGAKQGVSAAVNQLISYDSMSKTHTFSCPQNTTLTVRMVGVRSTTSGSNTRLFDPSLSLIYVPTLR